MVSKAEYKQKSKQLDEQYYDIKLANKEKRNDREEQRGKTLDEKLKVAQIETDVWSVRVDIANEDLVQAQDLLDFRQAESEQKRLIYTEMGNINQAKLEGLAAKALEMADDVQSLYGTNTGGDGSYFGNALSAGDD